MEQQPQIRPIRSEDDEAVAMVIRSVMPEFGASGAGFAINDPEVDAMYAAYQSPRAIYFVVEKDGRVMGGGGIAPLAGADPSVCELRKMYFLPDLRGMGTGRRLLLKCLQAAQERGFRTCYLETLKTMLSAKRLYETSGFERVDKPMGATGHFGCDAWYIKRLDPLPNQR